MSEDKLWGGRFTESTDALVEALNASILFDRKLYKQDICGSIAHARMLESCGLITKDDLKAIETGLREIFASMKAGEFEWRIDREDIHMNIEAVLREKIGEPAGRLHTARSRNDQVALDIRLWLRESILDIVSACMDLQAALMMLAEQGQHYLMPGYTHLQRAQPINAAHHMLAYVDMFQRDAERMLDCFGRTNILPLGSGALAGTPFPIDRNHVSETLCFDGITTNSMDAVSDRDFAIEFLSAAALSQVHLSRLSEELVLWTSQEFQFITLSDAFCTGSSIMPQKKNPDIPELVRGKTGRIIGDLVGLLTVMKGLPLAYNKDMQEDKEPLFDGAETLLRSLEVTSRMLEKASFNPEQLRAALGAGFLTATDLADALVESGMPFREAHEVVGKVVGYCVEHNIELEGLDDETLASLTGRPAAEMRPALDPERSVARRTQPGAPARSGEALHSSRERLQTMRERVNSLQKRINLDHLI